MANQSFRNLTVYKKAFELVMRIFKISKTFPKEERYSLTDQIRRSPRACVSCIAEAYPKRHYEAYFLSKSSDADMENSETQVWLEFALACEYVTDQEYADLNDRAEEIGRLVNHMIENPKKYLRTNDKVEL